MSGEREQKQVWGIKRDFHTMEGYEMAIDGLKTLKQLGKSLDSEEKRTTEIISFRR